jgi:hypothetical protein
LKFWAQNFPEIGRLRVARFPFSLVHGLFDTAARHRL